jgi:hypothetical protein
MAITIRYDVYSKFVKTTEVREFATEQAARWFLNQHLPKDARNIDIFRCEADEPRQAPTWYTAPKSHHPWWDANKRPFADRMDKEDRV